MLVSILLFHSLTPKPSLMIFPKKLIIHLGRFVPYYHYCHRHRWPAPPEKQVQGCPIRNTLD